MEPINISQTDPRYPSALTRALGKQAPATLTALGNLDLLERDLLALFCSVKCPGNLILQLYDFARTLRDQNIPVIGGFHTPMERECLRILLRGTQPVVICLARNLGVRQVQPGWHTPLALGRLLVVSPFTAKQNRISAEYSAFRNHIAAALAARVFVAYAAPEGKTEQLCRELVARHKPVWTFDDPQTENLRTLGSGVFNPGELTSINLPGKQ